MTTEFCTLGNPAAEGCQKPGWRRQFSRPTGFLGRLIGHLMAVKNKERSLWVISLLNVGCSDRVLEIGFGSGMDIRRVSEIAAKGFVAGIDHSEVMVKQARRRNATSIREGRVELKLAAMSAIPYPGESFDKVFSINSFQFSGNPLENLKEAHRVLKPGGRIAIAIQPRSKGATEETSRRTGQDLLAGLAAAGFRQVTLESKAMKLVSAVCALGYR